MYGITSLFFLLIGFARVVLIRWQLPILRAGAVHGGLLARPTLRAALIACSQLCGLGHYRMRGFYTIQSQAEYEAWLASEAALIATP